MSRRTLCLTDALREYLVAACVRETECQRLLREETARLSDADMQIAPEQGQFMKFLVELLSARRALEIGTFTGYSSLWIASGLPEDGRLVCCDQSVAWTAVARRYWRLAGLEAKIDLRLGPALDTLESLQREADSGSGGAADNGRFDFAFIDADKNNSAAYYDRVLELLRPGGVLALDNAFHGGRVTDPGVADEDAPHRQLNKRIARDSRVSAALLPIGDGLLLARKK